MIWDDEHIAWWERGRRNQMVNMEENPRQPWSSVIMNSTLGGASMER